MMCNYITLRKTESVSTPLEVNGGLTISIRCHNMSMYQYVRNFLSGIS